MIWVDGSWGAASARRPAGVLYLDVAVRLWGAIVLFVLRTVIAIPIVAAITHLVF